MKIDSGSARLLAPYPVRTGIPFAKAQLFDDRNVRAIAQGREIDLQTRTLSYWPDGSIKWLLLDFYAKSGDEVKIEFGTEIARMPVSNPIVVVKTDDEITLSSKDLQISVKKDGPAFLDTLAFDINANGKLEADEIIVKTAQNQKQGYFLSCIHRSGETLYPVMHHFFKNGIPGHAKTRIDQIILEEEGPLRAVVLIRGKFVLPQMANRVAQQLEQPGFSEFTVRIHFYNAIPMIDTEAHFVYEGVGDDDFINAWGFRLDIPKGMSFTAPMPNGPSKFISLVPELPVVGLSQTSADSYTVWQSDQDRLSETVHVQGHRSPGWIELTNAKWGLALGIRNFWERWPSAIHYDGQSGTAALMLYPPEAMPMDLRRYARREWGTGETSAPSGDLDAFAPFASKGVANTKEFRMYFRREGQDSAFNEPCFLAYNQRVLAHASPSYYSATLALGHYAPRKDDRHNPYEESATAFLDSFITAREHFRWYGMWDYGDCQQRFGDGDSVDSHRHMRWENDWGRWAWGNGDGHGRVGLAYLLQYLRNGERKYFEMGEAHVRHLNDVDIRESNQIPWDYSLRRKIPRERTNGPWWDLRGCATRHGVQHWSGQYIGARGGNPMGQRIYYYLTGDGRCADLLDMASEMAMTRFGLAGRKAYPQRLGASTGVDGVGTALQSLLIAWERSNDDTYRSALKSCLDLSKQILLPRNEWQTGMASAFGAVSAIAEYGQLTGSKSAEEIIIAYFDRLKSISPRHWMWPESFHSIPAAYYALTGNEAALDLIESMIDDQLYQGLTFNSVAGLAYQYGALQTSD